MSSKYTTIYFSGSAWNEAATILKKREGELPAGGILISFVELRKKKGKAMEKLTGLLKDRKSDPEAPNKHLLKKRKT